MDSILENPIKESTLIKVCLFDRELGWYFYSSSFDKNDKKTIYARE